MRYRTSKQRTRILDIIRESPGHITAEDIYSRMKKEFPRLSLGTVYRNLRILKEQGLISEFTIEHVDHFESGTSPHGHFICRGCGRVYNVEMPGYKDIETGFIGKLPYIVDALKVELHGMCMECKEGVADGEEVLLTTYCKNDSIKGGTMEMKEIRIHGRGGQGVVTAADLLAVAAFYDGKYAQAFPSFGSERMGAPVESYVKISDTKVRSKTQVYNPDFLIIQDPTLFHGVEVLKGLKEGGLVIVNTEQSPEELGLKNGFKVLTVPATNIALEVLGRPIPNTTLLGAFSGATGAVSFDAIKKSIEGRFSGKLTELNLKAAEVAYNRVKE